MVIYFGIMCCIFRNKGIITVLNFSTEAFSIVSGELSARPKPALQFSGTLLQESKTQEILVWWDAVKKCKNNYLGVPSPALFSHKCHHSYLNDRKNKLSFSSHKIKRLFVCTVHSVSKVRFQFRSQLKLLSQIRSPLTSKVDTSIP